ncbi:hypothetical protein [Sulfuricystis multivorans]|nr:hypothetical protein [Sulfuricystis multivorans]
MSLAIGLILSFAIIAFGGAGLAAFLIWLQKRDSNTKRQEGSGLRHA